MSTDLKRYYADLGVDPAASDEDIRMAFRRRAKELHPDAQFGDAGAFIRLKRAYDTLIDPDDRAAYDLACRPRPAAPRPPPSPRPQPQTAEPRRARPHRAVPPAMHPAAHLRAMPTRRGGVGWVRYVVAFAIMAAISIGGVQAMISWTAAPPSIQTRNVGRAMPDTLLAPATENSSAPGSSKSGFWDATPTAPAKKAP